MRILGLGFLLNIIYQILPFGARGLRNDWQISITKKIHIVNSLRVMDSDFNGIDTLMSFGQPEGTSSWASVQFTTSMNFVGTRYVPGSNGTLNYAL